MTCINILARHEAHLPRRLPPYLLASVAVLTFGSMHQAMAQQPSVNLYPPDPAQAPAYPALESLQLAQATSEPLATPGLSPTIPPPQLPPSQNPYEKADELRIRGWTIPLPTAADTLDQGLFGLRNTLADSGISYLGISSTTFQDNLLRHGLPAGNRFTPHSRDNQLYNGQLPTYVTQTTIYGNYDLRRYGIPDGQITVGGQILSTNWNPGGPDGFILSAASYYQTLFNRRVEVKAGLLNNTLEFLGVQVGGSLANGVFGPNASIPIENGNDSSAFPTYGVNVKVNLPQNYYTKVGVQRAISPDGTTIERLNNPTAANFKVSNAGVFVIDETGYRVPATPGSLQTWIRAAASYTTSRYVELNDPLRRRTQPSYGAYLLGDRQFLQTAPNAGQGSAARGIYGGFSVEYTPSEIHAFSVYYEARLYGFGLIPGRPFDLASIVATRSHFSGEAVSAARGRGLLAHDNTDSITASYGARVIPGVNLNFGVQYTDHPTVITYTGSTGSAFNVLVNTVIFL